jgi:THO complex subunit 5
MIARIEYEHAERQALEEKRMNLLKRKQTLIAENNRRKEILATLDKKIETWIDGAKPVQKEFERTEREMRVGEDVNMIAGS